MKLCDFHIDGLREALSLVGFNPRVHRDATFQAQSLLLQNAMNEAPELLNSPPTVCPLCYLGLAIAAEWTSKAALSIAKERKLS